MKDEELLNKIKNQMKDIEIPDSLKPESIKGKLEEVNKRKRNNKKRNIVISSIAAAVVILLGSISIYESVGKSNMGNIIGDNEYVGREKGISTIESYDKLYQSLAEVDKKNIGDKIDSFFSKDYGETQKIENSIMEDGNMFGDIEYSETNSQVEGVEEDDIVKTDGKYIYSLKDKDIIINEVVDGKSKLISQTAIDNLNIETSDINPISMYLYNNILVCIAEESDSFKSCDFSSGITKLIVFDITNKQKPNLIKVMTQDGSYNTSRLSEGILYTFSNYDIYDLMDNFKKEEYVPNVNEKALKCDEIYVPENINSKSYRVMTSINLNEPDKFVDKMAVVGSCDTLYMSENNIYIVDNINKNNESEILKFSYSDGKFNAIARNAISGYLNNQFSLDEKDGYLRIVGTREINKENTNDMGESRVIDRNTVNYLYILDKDLALVGTIDNLAQGERIYSVRFIKDMAYFVTFKETDPLFSVDLSDPKNPKVLGELKIHGFSTYLHPYGENLLLGIGEERSEDGSVFLGIKLSMYDISDPQNVVEKDKIILEDYNYSEALYNHKAVLVNKDKNIIGFALQRNEYNDQDYCVYKYEEGKGFVNEINHKVDDNNFYSVRGVYIGDYIYIVNSNEEIVSYNLKGNN